MASRFGRDAVGKTARVFAEPSAPAHWGFIESGTYIRSHAEVTNACTRAWHMLVEQVRGKCLSPAEAAELVATQPAWVQNMFKLALARWAKLTSFYQWPCAETGTSAEELLKRWVCQRASSDPNAWSGECDVAEKRSNTPCRFEGISERAASVGLAISPPDLSEACRVHAYRPSLSREWTG